MQKNSMNTASEYNFSFDASQCEECGGKCCIGESGYVFVTIEEMLHIAQTLNLTFEDFAQIYVRKIGYRFSLIEKINEDGYACIFFDSSNKKCRIYEQRPKQCRDFPFWNAHKTSHLTPENLILLQKECRGINIFNKKGE